MSEKKFTIVTKKDGTKIILNDDGTWENVKSSSIATKGNEKFHFRKTCWGWTKDQILNAENQKPEHSEDKVLVFNGTISGLECKIIYVFSSNKLVRTKYHIVENHSLSNQYIVDFEILKDLLTKKYGKHIDDNQFWHDDLYKDDYSDWGTAISLGHLVFITMWSYGETDINLVLAGDNYEINFAIEYSSRNLSHLDENEVENSTLLDL